MDGLLGFSFEGSLGYNGSQLNLLEESESTFTNQCHLYVARFSIVFVIEFFARNSRCHSKAGGNRDRDPALSTIRCFPGKEEIPKSGTVLLNATSFRKQKYLWARNLPLR